MELWPGRRRGRTERRGGRGQRPSHGSTRHRGPSPGILGRGAGRSERARCTPGATPPQRRSRPLQA
eukprot:13170428-Alexandrium_andersonii.AAC.1